jgi:hypothetical protein
MKIVAILLLQNVGLSPNYTVLKSMRLYTLIQQNYYDIFVMFDMGLSNLIT